MGRRQAIFKNQPDDVLETVDTLEKFLETMREREIGLYNKIRKSLDSVVCTSAKLLNTDRLQLEGSQSHAATRVQKAPPKIIIPRIVPRTPIDCLMTVPAVEIARQMTLLDWKIFWRIKVRCLECFDRLIPSAIRIFERSLASPASPVSSFKHTQADPFLQLQSVLGDQVGAIPT